MAWNLHAANLSDPAKAYLSALGSCGDERKAAAEVGATDAEVRNWARDDEFLAHRQRALEHFKSWQDWKPSRPVVDPYHDPYQVAATVDEYLGRTL